MTSSISNPVNARPPVSAARIFLFFAIMFMVFGSMMMDFGPGAFILAGILLVAPICSGSRLVQVIGIVLMAGCIYGAIEASNALQRQKERVIKIEKLMEERYGAGWKTNI